METTVVYTVSEYISLMESHKKAGTLVEASYKDEQDGFDTPMYIIKWNQPQGETKDIYFHHWNAYNQSLDAHEAKGTLVSCHSNEEMDEMRITVLAERPEKPLAKCVKRLQERGDEVLEISDYHRTVLAYREGAVQPYVIWLFNQEGETYAGKYYSDTMDAYMNWENK